MTAILIALARVRASARARAIAAQTLVTRALLNGDVHTFSSTQVDLPPSLADAVRSLQPAIPETDLAGDGLETRPHITVKYGIHTEDAAAVKDLIQGTGPIVITLGETAIFETEDADVVYVAVDSPQLVLLNTRISAAVQVTDTHPTYQPHATVAYVRSGVGQQYAGNPVLKGMTAIVDTVRFISKQGTETAIRVASGRWARFAQMRTALEFTDRYQALNIPYPKKSTMCPGPCEGTGVVPIYHDETDPIFAALWQEAEQKSPTDDGWHFVQCPVCHGTGLRSAGGKGSGNFGHAGRPGEIGGSSEGESDHRIDDKGLTHVGKFVEIYHGTNADRAKVIQKEGFRLRAVEHQTMEGDPEGNRDYHWFAKRKDHAQRYSEMHDDPVVMTLRIPEKVFNDLVTHRNSGPDSVWIPGALPAKYIYAVETHRALGGPGSGNFGHVGRPGEVGGSSAGDAFDQMKDGEKTEIAGYTVRRPLTGEKEFVVYNDTEFHGFNSADEVRQFLTQQQPSRAPQGRIRSRRESKPDAHTISMPVTIYHNSADVFAENKPDFPAYFGTEEFRKAFTNEWGQHTYAVTLPKGSRVLDLGKDSPEAREFMATVAGIAYPDDTDFQERLRKGDPTARSYDEFYDPWTDKRNVVGALEKHKGFDAVQYQNEYVLPTDTLKRLKGTKFKAAGGEGSGNFGHAGRPGEVGGSSSESGVLQPRPTPIKVDKVKDAIPLILQGKVVELKNVRKVNVLLTRLAKIAKDAEKRGEAAPKYDACQIVVPGSSIFCGEHLRTKEYPNGLPRVVMPQFAGVPREGSAADKLPKNEKGEVDAGPEFVDHLAKRGIATENVEVRSDSLKPAQAQLDGPKIAKRVAKKEYEARTPIFISRDGYIVDGHHRWAAIVGRDAEDGKLGDSTIRAIKIDAPISEILHIANTWTKRYGLERKEVKAAEAEVTAAGGPGSGNFGHAGRPGEIGGSSSEGGSQTTSRGSVQTLKSGKVTDTKGLKGSANKVLIVTLSDEAGQQSKAIFKPVSGESWTNGEMARKSYMEDMIDQGFTLSEINARMPGEEEGIFNDTSPIRESVTNKDFSYAEREAAAYDVDQALGLGVVPATTVRTINNEEGAVQAFVDRGGLGLSDELDQDSVYGMAILDIATGNTDRHMGNFLVDQDQKLVAVDHGLAFPSSDRTDEGFTEFRPIASYLALVEHPFEMSSAYEARVRKGLNETDWNALAARRWPNMNANERESFLERIDQLKTAFDQDTYDGASQGVRETLYNMAQESMFNDAVQQKVLRIKYRKAA